MVYKAKISIAGYNPGDIVPDEKAQTWIKMYVDSPVVFEPDIVKSIPASDPMDLNKDGKFDKEDKKIASKVLNKKIK